MPETENMFNPEKTVYEPRRKEGEKIPFAAVLAQFVDYSKEKRSLEKRLAVVKAEMETLEGIVLREFESLGVSSMKCGDTTVHLRRQIWARAKGGDKEAVCSVLQELGMGDMVSETFNTNTLSAWVREQEREEKPIPDALQDVIEITEEFSVRANMA